MTAYRLPPAGSSSPTDAWRAGLLAGFGAPGWALAASFFGFGALARELGLSLPMALWSSVAIWAVPGQMALVEMQALGADFLAIVLAVTLINARFLPMTLPLMVHLRAAMTHAAKAGNGARRRERVALYAIAHLVALTAWVGGMRVVPILPPAQRMPWFIGFGLSCLTVAMLAASGGFVAASQLPDALKLALVFLNPLFFLLVFAGDVKGLGNIAAILAGAAVGLAVHPVLPDWSLLIGGFVGGTAAFLIGEKFGARDKRAAAPDSAEP